MLSDQSFNIQILSEILKLFPKSTVGIKYPSENFKQKLEMISKIKKNEIKNLHIALIISSFDGFTQINFDYTDIDSVVIENTINSIPAKTFMHCQSLKKVIIPESVTHIEDGSFLQCTSLENIDLPSSITYIGKNAFVFCESLIRVKIPPSVTTIESFAFIYCSGMKWLEIPSSVTSINECAFSYCKLLIFLLL